jgi:Ca2+-binding RTX toxin-like protein
MPTITLSTVKLYEDTSAGTSIGEISIYADDGTDETSGYTVTFNDERFFYEYNATAGGLLIQRSTINYEALASKSISLKITAQKSGAVPITLEVDLPVVDIEEAPSNLTMGGGVIGEDAVAGSVVATLNAIDEDAGDQARLSYAFVTDASGKTVTTDPLFEIVGNQIKLRSQPGDAKAGTYTFWVRAFDDNSAGTEKDMWAVKRITLTITDTIKNPVEPVNTVNGGAANETLTGTAGADSMNGSAGNDKLYGYAGNDTLLGGAGKDMLYAGDGNDVLNGGLGKDKLYGGLGQDTFVFDTAVKKGQFDQIYDFSASDDTIQISLAVLKAFRMKGPKASDFGSKKSSDDKGKSDDKGRPDDKGKPDDKGGSKKSVGLDKIFLKNQKLQKKFFNVGTKLNDTPDGSNDYIFYNKKNGIVYLDVDGSGKGKGIEILKVKPGTSLTADDFLFI